MKRAWTYLLLLLVICFLNTSILAAEELVKVSGNKMKYYMAEDRLDISGAAKLVTESVTITSDIIRANFQDGEIIEIKATGNVTMEKDGDTFAGKELTYHLEKKTGLILELRSESQIEESDEIAYLSGKEAKYSEDLIDILTGQFTTCNLEQPHCLFRAQRIKLYPDDKIIAYHVTFWEFNGKVPLFYWPYYSKSLKDEKNKFTPSVGYSAATGWFLKTVYSFFNEEETHGELYLDYFQKLGFAGGLKYWYMDNQDGVGSVYLYLQQNAFNVSNPYLDFQHSQNYTWNNWKLRTNTAIKRYETQDTLNTSNTISYRQGANSFNWTNTFAGSNNFYTDYQTQHLTNVLQSNLKVWGINVKGYYKDNRYFHRPDQSYWNGYLKLSQRNKFVDWYLLNKKTGNRNPDLDFYYLPEFVVKLNFAGLQTKLKPYISPFDYKLTLGHYVENRTETRAYKWGNKLDFYRYFKLFGPLTLKTTASASFNMYSTMEANYEYSPAVELKATSKLGFYGALGYTYKNGDGISPFRFDRPKTSESQNLKGSIGYNKYGLRVNSATTFNLVNQQFTTMQNSINYRVKNVSMGFTFPYSFQTQKFSMLTGKASIKHSDLTFSLDAQVDPDGWIFKKMNSKVDWQMNDDWHVEGQLKFAPYKGFDIEDSQTRATMTITRNLHCREISVNYDFVEQEIWFEYNLTAYPKEKVRLGSNPNEPILLDLNLGGVTVGN